jgi:hypothetical protein
MNTNETIAQKVASWWNGVVVGSRDLAVQFAPVPAPIPLNVRHCGPRRQTTPRVINVLAYMDTRPVKPTMTK